jgi:hypothetical protein
MMNRISDSMRAIRCGLLCFVALAVMAGIRTPVRAQERTLALYDTVSGSLAAGAVHDWTLNASAGTLLSIFVRANDAALDPTLSILEGETILIGNDDYDYPNSRDAALEAITLPRTGSYIVRVGSYAASVGDYTLNIQPGYGQIGLRDEFEDQGEWGAVNGTSAVVSSNEGQLQLALSGLEQSAIVGNTTNMVFSDFYAEADISEVSGRGGWAMGLLARQIGDDAYAFEVDAQGRWRFVHRVGESNTVIRDWSTHPAIRAGEAAFRLGMLARQNDFDFFYNNQLLGSLTVTDATAQGRIAFDLRTGSALDSQTEVAVESLTVTIPVSPSIFPQQLIVADGAVMAQELERRGLIPPAVQALNVRESFIELSRAGVGALALGGGETYSRFALGAYVDWQAGYLDAPTGCGLVVGYQNTDAYTLAYLAQNGGYGLSARSETGFAPGLAGSLPALPPAPNHLLLVAGETGLHYYLNGVHIGVLDEGVIEGQIGVAAVNYEPVSVSCQFSNLWLVETTNE